MAQSTVHEITLWEPDLGSDITPVSTTIWKEISKLTINEKIGENGPEVPTATFQFHRGASLPLQGPDVLTERSVLKIQYGDPAVSWRLFRVTKISLDTTGERGCVVNAREMWGDLDDAIFRRTLANGKVDLSLTLVDQTLSQALTAILTASNNLPSTFVYNTVDASISSEPVVVDFFASSFSQILRYLSDQIQNVDGYKCEFAFTWSNGTGKYTITGAPEVGWTAAEYSGGSPTPSLRKVHGPGTTGDHNRLKMNRVRDAANFFNRIVPLSGDDDNPVDISHAEFLGASESGGYILLESHIRIIGFDGQYEGLYLGNADIGFSLIQDSLIGTPNKFQTDGSEAAMVDEWLRFAINSSGHELSYIDDSTVADHGAVEHVQRFPNVSPYPNLLVRSSVIASMDQFTTGLVDGWSKIGSPTCTEDTATDHMSIGTSSQKVVTNAEGEGISAPFVVEDDSKNPFVSCWVYVRADGTNIVTVDLVDVDGTIHPSGDELAQSNVDELRAFSIEGFELAPGAATVRIYAAESGATFWVDAVTVTQSVNAYEYADRMGPAALLEEGQKYLAREGGEFPPQITGSFLDVSAIQTAEEIVLGSHIEYKDIYSGPTPGSPLIDITSRVVEVKIEEGHWEGRLKKQIRLSRSREDFADLWKPDRVPAPREYLPPSVTLPEILDDRLPGNRYLEIFKWLRAEYPMFKTTTSPRYVKNFASRPAGLGVLQHHFYLQGSIIPDMDSFAWDEFDAVVPTKALGLEKDTTANDTDYIFYPRTHVCPEDDSVMEDFIIFGSHTSEGGTDTVLLDVKAGTNTRFKVHMDAANDRIEFEVTNEATSTTTITATTTGYTHESACMWAVAWDKSAKIAYVGIMEAATCDWDWTASAVLTGTFSATAVSSSGLTTGLVSQRYLATFCGADALNTFMTESYFVEMCRWLKPWLQELGHDYCIESLPEKVQAPATFLCGVNADICISNLAGSVYDINITPSDDVQFFLPAGSYFHLSQSAGDTYWDLEDDWYFETSGDIDFVVLAAGTGDITLNNQENAVGLYAGTDIVLNPAMDATGYVIFSNYPSTPLSGKTAEDEYLEIKYNTTVRYLRLYS